MKLHTYQGAELLLKTWPIFSRYYYIFLTYPERIFNSFIKVQYNLMDTFRYWENESSNVLEDFNARS